ncbi:Rne/Rng family ribonuclease [Paenibacillus physcomitrellae]|uniref:Ribonuclease G n=1 Tax=Paenibacillus physcomitrellae TaxID=1619311 RepID=A0ABQ1G3D9_9BACL|nr:Rne/Rng family ribonuclease [Paenibacillus physcomitrellae]GGA36622.1 ribonuclease G [Paenibacillus physcomitrellae]
MKQMVVHYEHGSAEMALLENGRLVEYAVERSDGKGLVGSVFKGRVANVIPGMQAAFVDIGQRKNAFLYIDDCLSPHLEKQPKVKPSITELLSPGQEIVVQVTKDAMGTKGARVTTHYSLPGRFIVYMPTAGYVAVSKKIEDEAERSRLKEIGEQLRLDEEGLIFRTIVEDQEPGAIEEDLALLRRQWEGVLEKADKLNAPALLHRDLSLVQRLIRDVFSPQTDELLVDCAAQAEEAGQFLGSLDPGWKPQIKFHNSSTPLFEAYGVKQQLDKDFQRKVWLPDGGYLIWDQTEAMNVVDVNTGKYVGTDSLEETVFQTNLQAAEEIARLLRVRDIGGIIIIDFIDMELEEHRNEVLARLHTCMRSDRTQHHILGWTKLGLLEMTRKKMRENTERK